MSMHFSRQFFSHRLIWLALLVSLGIEEVFSAAINLSQYVTSGGLVDNVYKGKATVIGTSALN